MKKVLLVFDGEHFDEFVINYAIKLNKQEPILATGVFLPAVDYAEILYSLGGVMTGPMFIAEPVSIDDSILQKNVARFREICTLHNMECEVMADETKHIVEQIAGLTRFADMLVIGTSSFYDTLSDTQQKDYVTDVLHKAECPVMLIPAEFHTPGSIVMAYDGSEQAMYAIKQFTYLFPAYKAAKVSVIYFSTRESDIPEYEEIADFMRLHYTNAVVTKMSIDASVYLETWLQDNKDALLVAGAYGRSRLSEAFSKSFIDDVISDHKVPVFVAHR